MSYPCHADPLCITLTRPWRDILLAQVAGELDLSTAPHLHTRLVSALADHPPAVLVVDLTQVRFLAAAGIAALLDLRERARERQIPLRLVAAQLAVLRPLSLLGLTEVFDVHASLCGALARGAGAPLDGKSSPAGAGVRSAGRPATGGGRPT